MNHDIITTNETYNAFKWVGDERVEYSKCETKCKNCGMYFHGEISNEKIQSQVKSGYFPSCDEVQRSSIHKWFFCKSWAND